MKSIIFMVSGHRWPVVSGVNDTADWWWAVSMTPLTMVADP
jgi:hypothetical protein